jgi:thiol peroxidase
MPENPFYSASREQYFTSMVSITFKGKPLHTSGNGPEIGRTVPDFTLVNGDLGEVRLSEIESPYVLLNVVPSLDTPVCAASAREFDREAGRGSNSCTFLTISRDLPFAQSRFVQREGLDHMLLLSDMRFTQFAEDYGVLINDGPLKGLCARAVFLLGPADPLGRRSLLYREMVREIAWEPDYAKVLEMLNAVSHSPAST